MYAEKQRPPPTPPFEGLKLGRMLAHSEGVKVYQGRYRGSDVIVRVRPRLGLQECCLLSGFAVVRACASEMALPSMLCVLPSVPGQIQKGKFGRASPPFLTGVCPRARAQLFKDSTWLRSLHGIPLEAAISAAHPHPNLARCSAMRRRGGSSGGDGIWTVTESFERSLQARAPLCAQLCAGR